MTKYDILVEPSRAEFDSYTLKDVEFPSPFIASGDSIELDFDLTQEQKDKDAEEGIERTSISLTVTKVAHTRRGNPTLKVLSSLKVK